MFEVDSPRARYDSYRATPLPQSFAIHEAHNLFQRVKSGRWLRRMRSLLTGQEDRLLSLQNIEREGRVRQVRFLGHQNVPIDAIRGSENRSQDFDADFRPLKCSMRDRWINIAMVWQAGTPLPPVELIKVGDDYYVRDGHHRISVMKAMGQDFVDANVTVWSLNCCAANTCLPGHCTLAFQ